MSTRSLKVKIISNQNAFRPQIAKVIFPQIYNAKDLRQDKNLKPIKLISNKSEAIPTDGKIKIFFQLLISNSRTEVFLYLNGHKTDMYYSVPSGRYSFSFYLEKGKNVIEMYYVVNGCKSLSVFKTLIRK